MSAEQTTASLRAKAADARGSDLSTLTAPSSADSGADPDRSQPCLTEEDVLAYLEGRPGGGTSVQRHVEVCARCRLLMAEAARAFADEPAPKPVTGASPVVSLRTLADGEKLLGRYQILRFVARGGMGEVYEARDLFLDERVALKTLVCTSLDDRRAISRLVAEVQLARKVTHPNVCRILEFGLHERPATGSAPGAKGEPLPFLTMEFLHGETLAERLKRRRRISQRETLAILQQMVAGLEAVHRAGIVHRDLKPENVFLLPGGEPDKPRVVLVDFGLARSADALGKAGAFTTGPFIVGTLEYMAPEQIEGAAPTPAFDVYALGVVLYEMLTGRKPHGQANRLVAAVQGWTGGDPQPPSSLVEGLDPRWDRIVARCLARDPAERFPAVGDVLRSLSKERKRRRTWRQVGRHVVPISLGLAVGAASALAAIAAFAGLWR